LVWRAVTPWPALARAKRRKLKKIEKDGEKKEKITKG
jgi:hypothetical protein